MDLSSLKITSFFFNIGLEVHTCHEIMDDLSPQLRDELIPFKNNGTLILHMINEDDRKKIATTNYPKQISFSEKFMIHVSNHLGVHILSTEKLVRSHVNCQYHGILWVFDRLVEHGLLNKTEACEKLESYIFSHPLYKCNAEMIYQKDYRLKKWQTQ